MPESLTSQQLQLRSSAASFAREELLPRRDGGEQARKEIIKASKEASFFSMTQPEAFGGTEATTLELCIVRDELAAHNPPFLHTVFGPGPGVLGGVGEPLRTTHLTPLIAGEKKSAFGFTEPDDASRATWGQLKGDTLIVNGQKSYVTGGAQADFINTLVQIDEHGPALVVIDTDTSGVKRVRDFFSLDGSAHAAFEFHDVSVPKTNVIGKPGEGMPRAMKQIGDTRLAIAAQCVGWMRWLLDYLTDHLMSPTRGGQKRGDREGVRLRYAQLRIQAFAARSMLYRTARLADDGANIVNEGIACKVFASEAVGDIVDTAIQLVGGAALVEGHPLELLYRQARALRLAEGGSDVLRLNLARGQLELHKGII